MSYQEYAQLGRNNNRHGRDRSASVERPYTGSHTSFSVPRRSPPHSKTSSTSTVSLSPSNSASQQNAASPPTGWDGSQKSFAPTRIRELDLLPEKPPNLVDVPLPWRPFYLQRRILVSFIVIFAALIVALEALLDFSNRNSGLASADQRSHYIWQYGPVLALTAIAALWNRVEFQAKSAAPWIRLSKGAADVERTLLLDYISMFQPWTVVAAMKNGDLTVAFTAAVSVIFKVLIILSTGLMALDVVRVPMRNMNVTLESSFVNNASGLTDAGSLALYTMVGLQQDNLSFPDGTSQQFAYQPFDMSSQFPEGAEVRTTVDGFYAGLECEAADMGFSGVQHHRGFDQLNTTYTSGDCAVTMPITSLGGFYGPPGTTGNETIYFARFGQGSCNNSTDVQDSRIVLVFGIVHIDLDSVPTEPFIDNVPVNGSIPRSTQLLCQPTYNISRVDVVKNGTALLNISLSDRPQNRTLSNVTPWNIAQAFFDSYKSQLQTEFRDSRVNYYLPQPDFGVDAQMSLATSMMLKTAGSLPDITTFFEPEKLYSLGNDFFTTYAALIAKRSLTEQNPTVVNGTAFNNEERLLVRSLTVHLVVGFLAGCVLLAIATSFLVPKTGFLPRDPNTIIDSAVLLAHSKPLLQALRGAGGGDAATIRDRLVGYKYFAGVEAYDHASNSGLGYFKVFGGDSSSETAPEYVQQGGSWPYPLGLHPVQRVSAIVIVLGIVAALEVTLRFSEANNGLGTVADDQYRHLLWTSLPAVIVSLVAVFFASIDFNTRALAPYARMRTGASFKQSINVNLLDKTTPVVLFEAVIGRNLAVIGTTTAFLIASLLSIFTASVFSTVDVPVTETAQLLSQDFFASSVFMPANESSMGNFNTGQNSTVVPSLILNANMSFPAFTYRDMAFPYLSVASLQDSLNPSADLTITATIPATRARMDCQIIPDDLINVNLTVNAAIDFGGVINPLDVSVAGDPANASITISTARGSNGVDPKSPIKTFIDPNAFFGAADYQPFKNASSTDNQTAHYIYIWGRLNNADTNSTTLESVSALTCNEVLRDVDVEVTFLGSSLIIDETRPPKPIESTDRPSTVAMEEAWNYNNMVNVSTPHLLDQFFTSLVQSRFAIPLANLGLDDNATRKAVADAIVAQHGIIRAQVTSTNLRRPTTNSTAVEDVLPQTVGGGVGSLGNATQIAYPATLESSGVGARRRVVQDLVTTRILQALLAAMIFFTVLGWVASPKPNILPRPPTSIASVAALLADGNLFGFLGRGAEWQSAEEVQAVFKDGLHVTAGFKLGWDKVRKRRREETLATWGMNGSVQKEEVFSISAMRTGGWGGGENVGLGLQARVGYGQRRYVRDWGWRQ